MAPLAGLGEGLVDRLARHGIDRRSFFKYCARITAVLALPPRFTSQIAQTLESLDKPSLIWLEYQSCRGNSEAFLRARDPAVADLVLDLLSVDFHQLIMAAAGSDAEAAKEAALEKGGHLLVVEGSIPLADGGVYNTTAGKTAVQELREAAENAAGIVAVGTCATYGGIPAAAPNPTGAVGVAGVVAGVPIINLSGCPANPDNITATLVHFLTFGALPATDSKGRPLFAYGERIHDHCERRAHFDAGQFVLEWGDEGHRKGWCLYRMGCKGPSTFHNCPAIRWNEGTSWPIGAGHPCVGCSEPGFWDAFTPFYQRLPRVPGFGVETTADRIGIGIAAATAVGFGAHGIAKAIQRRVGAAAPGPTPGSMEEPKEPKEE